MHNQFEPEEPATASNDVFLDKKKIAHKEATEEEEAVDREEALEHGLEGRRVGGDVEGPGRVVEVRDAEEEGVAQYYPGQVISIILILIMRTKSC